MDQLTPEQKESLSKTNTERLRMRLADVYTNNYNDKGILRGSHVTELSLQSGSEVRNTPNLQVVDHQVIPLVFPKVERSALGRLQRPRQRVARGESSIIQVDWNRVSQV